MRLIGSSPALIAPRGAKTEIAAQFETREARDYYIPNENKTILRYKVTVSEDHMSTLQLTTSKPDVFLKLAIYDNGEEVISVHGKGTALISAFMFLKDRASNETSGTAELTSSQKEVASAQKEAALCVPPPQGILMTTSAF